jgi:predicted Zn-dependent protease
MHRNHPRSLLAIPLLMSTLCGPHAHAQSPVSPVSVTPAQEVAWGEEALKRFLQTRSLSQDVTQAARVDRIGRRIAKVSDRPDHPYTFLVLEGKELQAYSFPGGTICLTEALAGLYISDDELAFGLAHELSHIVLRHHIAKLQFQEALKAGAPGAQALLQGVQGYFDRQSEMEADRYGSLYSVRANYAFTSSLGALERLGKALPERQEDTSHPSFAARITALQDFKKELEHCLEAFKSGLGALASNDSNQAVLLFRIFVGEFPNSFAGRMNLGIAHLARIRSRSGTPAGLAEALPVLPEAGVNLRELPDTIEIEHARENFAAALQLTQPGDSMVQAGMALVETRLGHWDAARSLLREALVSRPNNADLLLCLGNVEYLANNYSQAAELYRQSLAVRSEWPKARKNLALTLERPGGNQRQAQAIWKSLVGDKELGEEARLHLAASSP